MNVLLYTATARLGLAIKPREAYEIALSINQSDIVYSL